MHSSIENSTTIDEKIDDETFFEISALILTLNRKSFENISSLKSFHQLCLEFTPQIIENLDALYHLQYTIIKHFLEHRTKGNIKHLHNAFAYLQEESLVDKLSLEKLISLFDPSVFNENDEIEVSTKRIDKDFKAEKQALLVDIFELKKVVNSSSELEKIADYLNGQVFSIGITGVMNAGKSTMLNALMGKEVLGTSVVPETANLTIVKYSRTPLAKVIYWNKSQWQHIKNSAKSIASIAKFVEQTQNHFKDDLDSYILDSSREDEIEIDKLSDYTSAGASDKKCNLVKHVELYTPLDYLRDSIEIVDTPGLDDIVVQREEITKEYISKCDVLLHLMNVSQSATQKDIEFIIDAVLFQNITKVLIVITRIDMVSSKDVQEVIAYTRESIERKLHEQNSGSKLDFVLKTLHFIALSGKMALLHKTGRAKEAEDAGFTLKQSGIVEVEEYLQETLFGKTNARSSLIIRSAKSRLQRVIHAQIEELRFENSLLFKTEDEINSELALLKVEKSKQEEASKRLKDQIAGYEAEASNYLQTLQNNLQNDLRELQNIIKQRLMDETLYCLEKEKKAPLISSISRIIQTALKHGLVDIIREYRYKFIKKTSKIFEVITLQYDEIEEINQTPFDDAFKKGFLTANSETLIRRVSKVLVSASLSKLTNIDDEIATIIKDEFIYLQEQVKQKALNLSQTLLEEFFSSLREPLDTLNNRVTKNEELLQNHIAFINEDESTRNDKSKQLHERIKNIELIAKRSAL
ncbi:dynamin family protein [Candidatus Sulfurimonas marisnigri]|uniref:Dynamin family protein n=1 Tax=Candidatus Sulfurimonas marisnigri TaxID=2740405 RepID=A0A7S7M1G1_9BACT|nr:dynamin family protein [Candidatus Sulfurimonas marisnigri]QOY55270.1 dynamin family protein [Candidatus Sulfurimonas marisnigri]